MSEPLSPFAELRQLAAALSAAHDAASAQADADVTGPRLVIRPLADVEPQDIDWLWHRWLARGKFHLFAGHPGDGKSTLATWLAAIGSIGGAWPDGSPASLLRSLFILGEDSLGDTFRPRLDLFGADVTQIRAVETVLDAQGRERYFDVTRHLDLLEAAIVEHAIDLLVIDPLSTALVGSDRNAEGDMRDRLTPLVKLAERRHLAVLGIGHVGKPTGTNRTPLQRILGSTGLGALARLVWMTAPVDERMAVGPVKSNLATVPDARLWTREEDGPIVWHGSAGQRLEALLDAALPRTPRADAEGFLRELLATGSRASQDVERAAKAAGIAWATVRRAADGIGILKWKGSGTDGRWYWRLPNGAPAATPMSPNGSAPNLLTPIHPDVSKLSNFQGAHPASREQVPITTQIFGHGHDETNRERTELAQLAHPRMSRSEQVTLLDESTQSGEHVVLHDDSPHRNAVTAMAKRLASLTPDELRVYRNEIAAAPPDDPHVHDDRAALAVFDAMQAAGGAP